MIHIRASQLSNIMTEPRSGGGLSEGAKTYLKSIAKEYVYSFTEVVKSKYLDKGIQCEAPAIDLYNSVFFTDYEKNVERKTNEWITGECDIFVPGKKTIDIKNAWSLPTFPSTEDDVKDICKKSGYDWQARAYMMLWDVNRAEVAYCLVSTPEELYRYEQPEIHIVDHINPALRITRTFFQRDLSLEEKIKQKVALARQFLLDFAAQINVDHQHEEQLEAA